ncbi:MAG: pseudaminic acid synthase [Selenomonas sp.]
MIKGRNGDLFFIAEMSGNHNHSLARALQIVESAAEAGADAIKLQTYTADTMTIDESDGEFFISDPKNPWHGESLYQLYQKAYTPWEWQAEIFAHAKQCGILCFSTPFDVTAVDFLEKLDAPLYKIASFENIDLPLIQRVAETKKPLIASTGMATVAELDELVRTARENGCPDVTLLKCTSSYPASPAGTNLRTLPHLRELFRCRVGLSDHTLGIGAAVASIALGATVIEKHFTLARKDGGVDSAFSMEPEEFAQLVRECRTAYEALGEISYGSQEQEKASLVFRRSLYVVKDIKKGERFTEKNLRSIRPALGLPPKYYDVVLGKRASQDVARGTALAWEMVE